MCCYINRLSRDMKWASLGGGVRTLGAGGVLGTPQHFLNFTPLPHGHGWLRLTTGRAVAFGMAGGACSASAGLASSRSVKPSGSFARPAQNSHDGSEHCCSSHTLHGMQK